MKLTLLSESQFDPKEPLPDEDEFSDHWVCESCRKEYTEPRMVPLQCEYCGASYCAWCLRKGKVSGVINRDATQGSPYLKTCDKCAGIRARLDESTELPADEPLPDEDWFAEEGAGEAIALAERLNEIGAEPQFDEESPYSQGRLRTIRLRDNAGDIVTGQDIGWGHLYDQEYDALEVFDRRNNRYARIEVNDFYSIIIYSDAEGWIVQEHH